MCFARVCYAAIHILLMGSMKGRLHPRLVLLVPSIQFTPAMKRASSKFDPHLMKQLPAQAKLIIAMQGKQLQYEYCDWLCEERQLCYLWSDILRFALNHANWYYKTY